MQTSSPVVDKAQELATAGHHAEVVEYLGAQAPRELEASPSLALLYGTAQARLGRHDEGLRWLDQALSEARRQNEQVVARRALNARGAIALVSGRMDEAADYFTQALMLASGDGDFATTGRCSNNLGIISHVRGRHAEAIGSWEIAVAAFEKAGLRHGVAECRHNLGITYREQGLLDRALAEANHAVAEADRAGDGTLWALTLRGRAETYVARGELALARDDLARVRETRNRLRGPVDEAEDLRVVAAVLAADDQLAAAEETLHDAIERLQAHRHPQLLAEATRDLALVLRRAGRHVEAQDAARAATAMFAQLGAEVEIRKLASHEWEEACATELRRSLEPLHAAQELADAGRYAELVAYLGERTPEELEESPMLALLNGIGHARLGRLELGRQWASAALARSRVLCDRTLEVRALNVCGAIALERGGIREAAEFFARAQDEAMQDNNMTTVGRCANNLGIIANMQGDYGRAVGAYTRAIAAYQQAGYRRGIAETQHNLGISYRQQGQLDAAMEAADASLREANALGDAALKAQALAGRAEIRIARGEPGLAIREAEAALATHRDLQAAVRESEDLRILGVALGMDGRTGEAERLLRTVIDRATEDGRLELLAAAQRDLAHLLAREGDVAPAKRLAEAARATFEGLGARVEIEKLDVLLGEPDFGGDPVRS